MKKMNLRGVTFTMVLLFASLCTFATDGYFSLGYGTVNKGLAGAGTAFYQTSIIGGNPAGNVFTDSQFSFGIALFNPNRKYTITGNPSMMDGTFGLAPGTVESDTKLFLMPSLGKNWKLNEKSALTASIYGNGGMNTDYPTMTFWDSSSETTGVDLAQLFADVSYSYKLAEKHSIGVSGIFAFQYFEAVGVNSFAPMSMDPANVSNNGTATSTGFGFKIGYLGEFFDGFWFGAKYQSKFSMSEFDEYAGLFAEQGKFDIPSNWSVGIAYDLTSDLKVLLDVQQIKYTDSKAVSNPMMTSTGMNPMGADNGAGFGWDDMTVYKFAFNYTGIDTWTLRGGFSTGKQPIASSEVMFNILAPGVIENHLALGCSKTLNDKGTALNFSFNYAFNSEVEGPNPMEMPNQQMIKLEMNQLEFEIGLTF